MLLLHSEEPGAPDLGPLAEGPHTVGRAEDCDLRLDDPRISRRHARLEVSGERVAVLDLGSRNGVAVNGRRVREAALGPGDRVAFGARSFLLCRAGAQDPAPPIRERARLETDRLPSDSRRLRALHGVAGRLAADLERSALLPHVLDCLQEAFPSDRCALCGVGGDGGPVSWAARPAGATAAFSRTLARRVLERGEALLFDDVRGQVPFDLGESVAGLNIRSVLCAPIALGARVLGLLYVDRSLPGAYDIEDLALLRSVAALVAVALENARLHGELRSRYEAAERRLLDAERAAALGRLALALAHEVRNPVTVIGGLARRLGRGTASSEVAEAAASIREEAERLERMMGRVEALAEVPRADVRPAPLGPTVAEASAEAEPLLRRRGLALRVEGLPAAAAAPHDPALLRMALAAALEHASRQVPAGGEVWVRAGEEAGAWVVDVADGRCPGEPFAARDLYAAGPGPEPWALDLALALAERAMAAQGGEVRGGGRAESGVRVRLLLPRGASPFPRT